MRTTYGRENVFVDEDVIGGVGVGRWGGVSKAGVEMDLKWMEEISWLVEGMM